MERIDENRLFARTFARDIDETPQSRVAQASSDITNAITVRVPVDPTDTVADVRQFLENVLAVHVENIPSYPQNSMIMSPTTGEYGLTDAKLAAAAAWRNRAADEIFDPEALPYDTENEKCRTQYVVEVIPIADESAALDLYMEAIDKLEQREFKSEEYPESYQDDTCAKTTDGRIFSRDDAANDEGYDDDDITVMTLAEAAAQQHREPEQAPVSAMKL